MGWTNRYAGGASVTDVSPPLARVESSVDLGETDAWIVQSYQHLTGAPWPVMISTGAVIIATLVAVGLANHISHPAAWAVVALVGVIGIFRVRLWLLRRLTLKNVTEALATRGVHYPMTASMTVTESEVHWKMGVFESRCPIDAISDVIRLGPFLLLTVQGSPVLVPERAFDSPEHRMMVLAALRRGMTAEAVARSPDLSTQAR